jgi:serine protease AprX
MSRPFLCLIFFILEMASILAQEDVLQYISLHKKAPVLVVFKSKAELSKAEFIADKIEKGEFVFKALNESSKTDQKSLQQYLGRKGIRFSYLPLINGLAFEADLEAVQRLNADSKVDQIILDLPFKTLDYYIDDRVLSERSHITTWGIKNIKADSVWLNNVKGKGVTIAGFDTGVTWNLPQIKASYRGDSTNHNYHWHDAIIGRSPLNMDDNNPCGYNVKSPCDDDNHGTHTVGTMVGQDTSETIGVAPLAKWIACRNMERGWGKLSTYVECFNWALAPTDTSNLNPMPSKAPDVINNSWGCPVVEGCDNTNWHIMKTAIINLKAAGIVVVASAGNNGSACGTVSDPLGFFKESFSVGAYASNNTIAGFSSRGASLLDTTIVKPNISAPGVGVRSVLKNGSFANFSGTSMAGPHVAGVVALMISAVPSIRGNVKAIENILERSSITTSAEKTCHGVLATSIPNNTYGYGRLDAKKAVYLAYLTIILSKNKTNELLEFDIIPNPATDQIILKGLEEAAYSISIYNLNGHLLHQSYQSSNLLTLPDHLTNGVNILRACTTNACGYKRLLVAK